MSIAGDDSAAETNDCIGWVFDAAADSICEPSKFISQRNALVLFVSGVAHELSVVEELAGVRVHDRHCLVHLFFQLPDLLGDTAELLVVASHLDC